MKYSAIFLSCLNFAPKKGLLTAQFARYSTIVGYHWKITKFFRSFAKLRVDISTFCNLKETVNTHSYHLQIPLHPDPIDLYSAVADVTLVILQCTYVDIPSQQVRMQACGRPSSSHGRREYNHIALVVLW